MNYIHRHRTCEKKIKKECKIMKKCIKFLIIMHKFIRFWEGLVGYLSYSMELKNSLWYTQIAKI